MSETIRFERPDGRQVPGYLAAPEQSTGAPGVVVIQEWWGLDDQIKAAADRLAAAGFRALVPDLYRGKLTLDAKEAEHLMNDLDFGAAAGQDVRGAVQYLKASGSSRVGINGFCMGGALSLLSAMNVPEADAVVIWYGYPPLEYVDTSKIEVPLLGHWGTDDEFFPIDGVDKLETKLRAAGKEFTFFRYQAKHAFANESADSKNLPPIKYDPEAAELAWRRTLAFLAEKLR